MTLTIYSLIFKHRNVFNCKEYREIKKTVVLKSVFIIIIETHTYIQTQTLIIIVFIRHANGKHSEQNSAAS